MDLPTLESIERMRQTDGDNHYRVKYEAAVAEQDEYLAQLKAAIHGITGGAAADDDIAERYIREIREVLRQKEEELVAILGRMKEECQTLQAERGERNI